MNAPVRIKGWCPSALRPMMSGDGLLVRVRVRDATLSPIATVALTDLAQRFGNGRIELTQRANLQIRGVREHSFPALIDGLRTLGLVDREDDWPAVNIVTSPLAGLDPTMAFDPRLLAAAVEAGLRTDAVVRALPSKFGFAIDGGGVLPLGEVGADIVLSAPRRERWSAESILVGLAGSRAATLVAEHDAPAAALGLVKAFLHLRRDERRMRALVARLGADAIFGRAGLTPIDVPESAAPVRFPLGAFAFGASTVVGVAAPFGAWSADDLAAVAASLDNLPDGSLRVTPWRILLLAGFSRDVANEAVRRFAERGLIVSTDDPRLAIAACVGAGGCPAASVETRLLAAELAKVLPFREEIALHVSGCAKGCAHPRRAPLSLVGRDGGYDLVLAGGAGDEPAISSLSAAAAAQTVRERLKH